MERVVHRILPRAVPLANCLLTVCTLLALDTQGSDFTWVTNSSCYWTNWAAWSCDDSTRTNSYPCMIDDAAILQTLQLKTNVFSIWLDTVETVSVMECSSTNHYWLGDRDKWSVGVLVFNASGSETRVSVDYTGSKIGGLGIWGQTIAVLEDDLHVTTTTTAYQQSVFLIDDEAQLVGPGGLRKDGTGFMYLGNANLNGYVTVVQLGKPLEVLDGGLWLYPQTEVRSEIRVTSSNTEQACVFVYPGATIQTPIVVGAQGFFVGLGPAAVDVDVVLDGGQYCASVADIFAYTNNGDITLTQSTYVRVPTEDGMRRLYLAGTLKGNGAVYHIDGGEVNFLGTISPGLSNDCAALQFQALDASPYHFGMPQDHVKLRADVSMSATCGQVVDQFGFYEVDGLYLDCMDLEVHIHDADAVATSLLAYSETPFIGEFSSVTWIPSDFGGTVIYGGTNILLTDVLPEPSCYWLATVPLLYGKILISKFAHLAR